MCFTNVRVFFRGVDGQLVENDWVGRDSNWRWSSPHEPLPDGTQMASAPVAITHPFNVVEINYPPIGPPTSVFVQGANGQLYEHELNTQTGEWVWITHGLPPDGVQMASAPAAFWWIYPSWGAAPGPTKVEGRNVFFRGANGQLYERFTNVDQGRVQDWAWNPHGLPPNGARMASAPSAIFWALQDGTPQADVFFSDDTGALVQAHWDQHDGWSWNTKHGQPPGTTIATGPTAMSFRTVDGLPFHHVFCGGADGQLYQRWRLEGGEDWQWEAHGLPPDGTAMDSAPAVLGWMNYRLPPRKCSSCTRAQTARSSAATGTSMSGSGIRTVLRTGSHQARRWPRLRRRLTG